MRPTEGKGGIAMATNRPTVQEIALAGVLAVWFTVWLAVWFLS